MHIVALIIAGFMTLLLAGPALLRGGLVRAWLSTAASIVPCWVLYLAYGDSSEVTYLLPAFILFSITLFKAVMILKDVVLTTPKALDNVAVSGEPHWAS